MIIGIKRLQMVYKYHDWSGLHEFHPGISAPSFPFTFSTNKRYAITGSSQTFSSPCFHSVDEHVSLYNTLAI